MPNARATIVIIIGLFILSFGGCYTILKHPPAGDSAHEYSGEYYRENCLDCHPDYQEFPYGYYYGSYPEYYFEYSRWGQYYAYPWWWDHLWYDGQSAGYHGDDAEEYHDGPGVKTTRSRGGMAPPYTTGSRAIESSEYRRGGTGGTNPGQKPATGGTTTTGGEEQTSGGKTKVTKSKTSDSSDTGSVDSQKKTTKKKGTKTTRKRGGGGGR